MCFGRFFVSFTLHKYRQNLLFLHIKNYKFSKLIDVKRIESSLYQIMALKHHLENFKKQNEQKS